MYNSGPVAWVSQIFKAKAVTAGGIIRRKLASVLKYGAMELLLQEVRKRGFHLIQTGDQLIIVCNAGNIQIIQ